MSFKSCIKNSRLFKKVFYFKTIDSTNDHAFRISSRYRNNFIVVADKQTDGRGRFNRIWFSPARENIYFSLFIQEPVLDHNDLSILTAQTMLKVLQSYKRSLQIKWPNDIICDQKKVSGLLIENQVSQGRIQASVIGVGINCFTNFLRIGELKGRAVSLRDLTDKPLSREKIFNDCVSLFEKQYLDFSSCRKQVFADWKKNIAYLHDTVTIKAGSAVYSGVLKRVNRDGSILLADGRIRHKLTFGEMA
ncbi:MAG: biotin--[acetyl-CoA-carboxylase] ligase [bacterium]|nr:biotin--[acetyl-CoA-carboxylase] ligase [bacterium]